MGTFLFSLAWNSKQALNDRLENITRTKEIKQENELLKSQLNQLTFQQKNYYREIEIAHQRLQKLLNFMEQTPYHLIPARVLAYSPEDYFKVIYVDRGREDAVMVGKGVVNVEGLVGKVVEVYERGAKVMLIIDKRSNVGVRVQKSRDIGILRGTGNPGLCELDYILTNAEVDLKDAVVTSGLGMTFLPGIVVGYISSIEKKPNYLFQRIEVAPVVDFGKLEELFLVAQNG